MISFAVNLIKQSHLNCLLYFIDTIYFNILSHLVFFRCCFLLLILVVLLLLRTPFLSLHRLFHLIAILFYYFQFCTLLLACCEWFVMAIYMINVSNEPFRCSINNHCCGYYFCVLFQFKWLSSTISQHYLEINTTKNWNQNNVWAYIWYGNNNKTHSPKGLRANGIKLFRTIKFYQRCHYRTLTLESMWFVWRHLDLHSVPSDVVLLFVKNDTDVYQTCTHRHTSNQRLSEKWCDKLFMCVLPNDSNSNDLCVRFVLYFNLSLSTWQWQCNDVSTTEIGKKWYELSPDSFCHFLLFFF